MDRKLILKKGADFFLKDEKMVFVKSANNSFTGENSDKLVNKIKLFLKKYPVLFNFAYNFFGASPVGRDAKAIIKEIDADKLIVNLGSGARKIQEGVVNVDFYPFKNVDIVADISDLPFADSSVDVVINEFVLEHVPNPEEIVAEIKRILKPGGIVYVSVPFVMSFHSSPNDYYRWSKQGLRELLRDFQEDDCGIKCGPTSAMRYVVSEWLATILSFNLIQLQQLLFMFFMVVSSPLNLFDFLISNFKSSENIAVGFYFIGRKK